MLTAQCKEDGTAQDLYESIQEDKKKLLKEGKIEKIKLIPITETDIPYAIPDNWKWIRWGDLSERIQYGYNAPGKQSGRIKMVRISDIQDGKVMWDTVPYCDIEEDEIDNYLLHENDILFARTGGTVGKSYIVGDVPEEAVFAGYLIRTSYSDKLCSKYMKYFMESKLYWKQLQNGTVATAQPNCNGKTLSKMMLPLPPYREQIRIVDIIDSVFEAIDELQSLQDQYIADRNTLKSKLIDAAIQGKLTEQLPEDGTAEELFKKIQEEKAILIKEGKIKKEKTEAAISDTEVPFEIPENWKWVRLCDISYRVWAGGDKPDDFSKKIDEIRKIPVVANGVSNEGILGYTSKSTASKNTITVAGRGTIGFTVLRRYDYCPIVRLIVIEQSQYIEPRYLQIFLQSMPEASVGSSIPQLTVPMIKPKLVPLPPLEEQVRISDRVYKLLEVISE